MGRFAVQFFVLVLYFASLFFSTASAYTLTQTPSGSPIKWSYGQKIMLAGNSSNLNQVQSQNFYHSVVNALQQWKWASSNVFDFEYWQGSDSKKYPTSFSQDGYSTIFFASNSNVKTDPNIIGYTQVWYNTQSGELIETDTLLNDRDYELTNNPSDTSSQSSSGWGTKIKVYLNNIVTHELGHAVGLSHSTSINSSMLYVEYKEQSKIGCDDWSATRHLYAPENSNTGSLTGSVVSPSGDSISGAVVTAISKDRGIPLASVLTDQRGNFNFGALEAGIVSLLVQPYQGSPSSIPSQFQARTSHAFCGGKNFPTYFSTQADQHSLLEYPVRSHANADAGTLRISCVDSALTPMNDPNTYSSDMSVGSINSQETKSFAFLANGPFKVTGISYLLMSSVKLSISVTDSKGNPVKVSSASPIYQSNSGFQISDAEVTGIAEGPIFVKVSPSALPWGSYPNSVSSVGANPYFVLTFNTGAQRSLASSDLPDNARCAASDPFPEYQSPSGDPMQNTSDSARSKLGFCGSINKNVNTAQNKSRPYFKNLNSGPTFGEILGWLFPFLVAIFDQGLRVARKIIQRRRLLIN